MYGPSRKCVFRAVYPAEQKHPEPRRLYHGWQSRPTDGGGFGTRGKLDHIFHIEITKETEKNVMVKKQLLLTKRT